MSSLQKIERRYIPSEIRVDEQGRIEGYAAVFDKPSEDLGGFREFVRPGAFTKTLREADIRALFNHDPNYVLGRNRASTLELAEDSQGLHFRVLPPETVWANDLKVSARRGDINQGSFGFNTIRDEWRHFNETRERDLLEVRLFDVSIVTYPAYPQTAVNVRSLMNELISGLGAENDPGLIQLAIDQMQTLLSTAPVEDNHPVEGLVRMAQLRQKLQLLERM